MNQSEASDALVRLWNIRDARYRVRKTLGVRHPLSPLEVSVVKGWRRGEVAMLPVDQREYPTRVLEVWTPPRVRPQ